MPSTVEIVVHADVPSHRVSRPLYSHFAEHLGRCIYGGHLLQMPIPTQSITTVRMVMCP